MKQACRKILELRLQLRRKGKPLIRPLADWGQVALCSARGWDSRDQDLRGRELSRSVTQESQNSSRPNGVTSSPKIVPGITVVHLGQKPSSCCSWWPPQSKFQLKFHFLWGSFLHQCRAQKQNSFSIMPETANLKETGVRNHEKEWSNFWH